MERTVYKPTDDEAERIERAGMAAALAELQLLEDDDIQVRHGSAGVLACLRAFKAARNASFAAQKRLLATKHGYDHVSHYPEVTDMVCSAMVAMLFGRDASECSPRSVAGGRISILFQAAKALEAMSTVYSAFDDDDSVLGTYLADETTALAEAAMQRHNAEVRGDAPLYGAASLSTDGVGAVPPAPTFEGENNGT